MTNTEPLTADDRAAINARLAKAMGWIYNGEGVGRRWVSPDRGLLDQWFWQPPDLFTNATASRELIKWIAKDETRRRRFARKLCDFLPVREGEMRDTTWPEEADAFMALMVLPLECYALAADAAIESEGR